MPKQHILKEQWTVLPSDKRLSLRKKYDLRITEDTYVIDDRVISDGVSLESLAAVFNVDRMRAELNASSAASCDELWFALLNANRSPAQPTPTLAGTTVIAPEPEKVEPKKKRTTKKPK